ncbi:MAG: thermonuclease family protein [Beijerinckiaceae bacterium]|nr:thermonuclease family protein [Beijerinckiaceae bacterium]
MTAFYRAVPLLVALVFVVSIVAATAFSSRPSKAPAEATDAQAPSESVVEARPSLPAKPLRSLFAAKPLRVIDGDTVEMRVSIWLGQDVTTRVRMRGIDAPELRARCEDELLKAEAAKQFLADLLARGEVFLSEVGYDKYGTRVLARIVDASGADLGASLVERGLARPYQGGKRQSWCEASR